jgi:hypothetical protein
MKKIAIGIVTLAVLGLGLPARAEAGAKKVSLTTLLQYLTSIVPGTDPSSIVPGTDPSSIVPGTDPSSIVPGTDPSSIVPGTDPSSIVSGELN